MRHSNRVVRKVIRIAMGGALACLVAFSPARARDSFEERVDALFESWIEPGAPGCALGVVREGKLSYAKGYGTASLEHDVPITPASVFRTGSVGKQFTAFVLLLAEQRGELSLDDDVRKYVPELPETGDTITLRHLVHHTSGIRDYLVLMDLAGKRSEDFYTEKDVLRALSRQEHLNFEPGSEYLYSNSGYFLLSQIVLRATGMTLAEYARVHLFEPLGMKSTHFHDDFRRIVKNRAEGYRPKEEGGFEIHRTTLNMVGDGGVFTTIEDLLLWDQNFFSGRVGGKALASKRLETGWLIDGTEQDYAFGLRIGRFRGRPMIAHDGAFVGFRASMMQLPEEELSVYVLCNRADAGPGRLSRRVAAIAIGEPEERDGDSQPEAHSIADAAGFEGAYFDRTTGEIRDVTVSGGALLLDEDVLVPGAPAEFVLEEDDSTTTVRFEGLESGMTMTVRAPGQRSFTYEWVAPVEPDLSTLARYLGLYRSSELDVVYRVELEEDDRLVLVRPNETELLTPAFRDGFRFPGGTVLFDRGGKGEVAGFRLASGRARNFVFEKL